ncbi:sulfotransferase domain-containing protein [Nonomuraea sp. NPDC003727]
MNAMKHSVMSVSRTTGRLTSGGRVLPSFLIVGAQRCGTTSLYRALAQHPLLLKPVLHKGIHYFDIDYAKGPSWYQGHFPLKVGAALLKKRYGRQPLAFESAPYYMFHPLAGERIVRDLPGVKLIVLVRDPVERAFSAHSHELARGFELESHFEYAVELELRRLAGAEDQLRSQPYSVHHSHRHHAYLARGRYAEQLNRLEPLFGRERILVIDSHRFFAEPEVVHDEVLDFLGVPPMGDPVFERHNGRSRPKPLPEPVRQALMEHFEVYDLDLVPWLGGDPSWRR